TTTNLRKHLRACKIETTPNIQTAMACTYSRAAFRILSTEWIVESRRPFAILQDRKLQKVFRMLYSGVEIQSAPTVSTDIK
ncbi:hypothetical protein BT69DRAFT_1196780, partial [Atractiella rhizophila]